ncbi:hypothetical protein GX441_01345 [bacterium]|nr:hypothetical protein [bacterium]
MMVFLPKILFTLSLLSQWQGSGPDGGFVHALAAGNGVTYAYTDQGLYRRGSDPAWKRIDTPNLNLLKDAGINKLVMFGDSLVACTRKHGLLISRDSGVTWSNLEGIPADADVVGIVPVIDSIYSFFAATRSHGVWKYDWFQAKRFVQVDESWAFPGREIAAISAKPERDKAAISIEGSRVVKIWNPLTSKNWEDSTYMPSGLAGRVVSMGWIGDRIFVGTANGVAFVESSTLAWQPDVSYSDRIIKDFYVWGASIWAATNRGIISNLGGSSAWTDSNEGLSSLDAYCLSSTSPLAVSGIAGMSDNVYTSSVSGWSVYGNLKAQTFMGLEIDPQYPKMCYAASLGGGIYKSPDGALTWKRHGFAETPVSLCLTSAKGTYSTVYLYAGNSLGIASSANGAEGWVQHPDAEGRSVILASANLSNPRECWFVTRQNFPSEAPSFVVYHSDDACATSDQALDLAKEQPLDMTYAPSDGGKMFLLTVNGLYRTNASGQVEKVPVALPAANGILLEAGGGGRLFMLGSTGKIYTCSNSGEVWSNFQGPPTSGIVRAIAADTSSAGLLVAAAVSGSEISVFFTTDTGKTWTRIASPLQGDVHDLAVKLDSQTQIGHVYVATATGINYAQFTVSGPPDDLKLSMTAEAGSFSPEIGAKAVFHLDGDDFMKVTSWSVSIRDTADNVYYYQSGATKPAQDFTWDGFTESGWLAPAGVYTATFQGQSGEASGEASASIALIIGNPPQSTSTDATSGTRLLLQYPQAGGDLGYLLYRSLDVPELFGVADSTATGHFFLGQDLSNTKDSKTTLASLAMAQDGTHWRAWTERRTDGTVGLFALHHTGSFTTDTLAALPNGEDIMKLAVAVAKDSTPLVAVVKKSPSGETGELYHRASGAWVLDTVFSETGTDAFTDLDILRASDGVHIFYSRGSTGYDYIWNGPGTLEPKDNTSGVVELSATSLGDDKIYLLYTDGAGKLFFRERTAGSWGSAAELKGYPGFAMNITCNVNAAGKITAAWQAAGAVYFNQRTATLWGTPQLQTPSGSAFFPQLPQCTYSDAQPLIAWTEGVNKPYFVRLVPLGEAPPADTIILTLYSQKSLLQGSPLSLAAKSHRIVNSMQIHLENETGAEFWPDSLYPPADSVSYDSLTVFYKDSTTMKLALGGYRVIAEAHLGSLSAKVEDTLNIVENQQDTTVLMDPAQVFFLPNPAVRQSTAKIYYNLSADATRVELEIYTARGKRISFYEASDGDAIVKGARKFLEVDISGLGPDVYFFRLVAEDDSLPDGVVIKPFVVVK